MILQKRFTNHKPLNNSGYAEQTNKEQEKKIVLYILLIVRTLWIIKYW